MAPQTLVPCPACRFFDKPGLLNCRACGHAFTSTGSSTGSASGSSASGTYGSYKTGGGPSSASSATGTGTTSYGSGSSGGGSAGSEFSFFGSSSVRVRGNVLKVDHAKMKPVFRMTDALRIFIIVVVFLGLFGNVLPQLLKGLLGMLFSFMFLFGMISILPSMMMGMPFGRMGMPNPMGIANRITGGLFRSFRSFSHRGHSGGPREISVHNITLVDKGSGRKVLVRIEGDIIEGHCSSGDDIEVEGDNHHGTILFRRGVNHSLGLAPGGTRIVVALRR